MKMDSPDTEDIKTVGMMEYWNDGAMGNTEKLDGEKRHSVISCIRLLPQEAAVSAMNIWFGQVQNDPISGKRGGGV